ncbi:aldehyde dehydrogenase [Virgibacillus pantothenticus]|uniref:aldehyde dehydrogenase n=1 Tax=Virgibacillus pantothenticus TaxID=1473 RepID=UPI001C22D492|nr:aldehyde dehydrogenase [Virgibacillus pantothenticus]MBU8566426.1 aldehyde dehydrogenase [Virgibacillus pantothenticus]MBU8600159.1 aldehyde dehydrogenase [Virgibacillus pantothenticus]MBU8633909.1 aldehyde dehydrogenase [Virgibacillus pantothenticus]MBU8641902.1 aldehyde dehydrogenase [Virgibacillus pantothenticus]MBU8645686.1 aldehyde dehydrogenase [Virgibacillus pantothenticus]
MTKIKIKPFDCFHYINGSYINGNGKTFENINPATEEVLGRVALGGQEEVNLAVDAARMAMKGKWSTIPLRERSAMIRKIGDLILERKEHLATLETLDTGKPIWLSKNVDIERAAYNFYFFADYMTTLGTEAYQQDDIAIHYAVRRPVGVVGLINPWNLPLFLMTWKLAPALAAGNTVVMKPSEVTPMTATVLAEICTEAGVPDGVVNMVHGFGETGAAISAHRDVDAIAFTGETITGSAIMEAAAPTLKKLSFELGGKNPNIIFGDADLDDVIETTLRSSFINQGEVCLCGSRIYVERNVYNEFLDKFTEKTKELKVGDPFEPDTKVGALVSKEHYYKVLSYLSIAREEGGHFLTGGKAAARFEQGFFVEPTIITGLGAESRCVREEIFGPVVTVIPFDTEKEVLKQVNDTHYGLSASLWTRDIKRATNLSAQIEAGTVWVNTWFLRDLRTPFGGMKHSGIGREGGIHSFDFYSELTNITLKL